ncbi:unnamed protein product [Owenia fusiformis]|uniref:DUF3419 family protein n=1 Tax=Owenia fusiformis TaxID=6347 RepID=A0A8S4MVI4_OWEFU|nr:unnamed protein product [Owenia fusiformis]
MALLKGVSHLFRTSSKYFGASGLQNRWYSEEVKKAHKKQNTEIMFSMNWEDVAPIRHAMGIKSGDRIFTIASCGANAMTLLLDDPAEVVALDLSIPQLHLAKLQAACIKHLTYQEFIDFAGVDRENVKAEERVRIYENIRKALESDVREFWDSMTPEIEFGIIHCGTYDTIFRNTAEDMVYVALDTRDIKTFLEMGDDIEEQANFFEEVINTKHWRKAMYRLTYHTTKDMDFSIIPDVDYATFYYRRMVDVYKSIPMKENYFGEYLFTGGYSGKNKLRDYLQEENFAVMKDRVERLQWVHGELTDWLAKYPASTQPLKFDGICISNITDWLSLANHNAAIESAVKICNPGGRIMFWNLKGMSKYWPSEMIDKAIKVEHEIETSATLLDRAVVWEPLRVATVI